MFNNQGTSKPEASQKENGDMAWAGCEELVELDDVQLATVVGGWGVQSGSVPLPINPYLIRSGQVFVYQGPGPNGVIWITSRQPRPGQPGGNVGGNGARLLNQFYY